MTKLSNNALELQQDDLQKAEDFSEQKAFYCEQASTEKLTDDSNLITE